MLSLLMRRLALLPVLLLVVSLIGFFLPYLIGVDPAAAILNSRMPERGAPPEVLDRLRLELGLDQPLPVQYLGWLGRLVRGDLGYSYASRAPVAPLLGAALKTTATLAFVALALAVVLAIPLGVAAALKPGKWLDTLIAVVSQTGVAIPEYWLGPMLILFFALQLRVLPSAGWRGPLFIVLPALTMAFRPLAYFTRVSRTAMIDVMSMEYIRAARAKGLTSLQTIWRHGLRNALIPVVTMVALWLAAMLGGSVIVEVIFAVPGVGRVMYQAVLESDLPVIQSGLVLIVGLAVVVNTLTDLAYLVANPAIRFDRAQM